MESKVLKFELKLGAASRQVCLRANCAEKKCVQECCQEVASRPMPGVEFPLLCMDCDNIWRRKPTTKTGKFNSCPLFLMLTQAIQYAISDVMLVMFCRFYSR